MILIMLGPPGSGKGTQSNILASELGIITLSTGQMLRDIMADDPEGELATQVRDTIQRGDLISDKMMTEVLDARMQQNDCKRGVILDGYPRNMAQVAMFDDMIRGHNVKHDIFVLYFDLDKDEITQRLTGRYSCADCNAQYHKEYKKPKVEGVCDECGGTHFITRKDDEEEAIRHRLKVYEDATYPLLAHYEDLGKVVRINAASSINAITSDILSSLRLMQAI